MTKIIYIEYNGTEHSVDVEEEHSVMEGAVNNSIPGIDADCGGQCACATCHVYVDPAWQDRTGVPNAMEQSMLEFTDGLTSQSRLSCQIKVTPELEGLIVRLPKSQH
jgi:ferredoxin, 2Fe-2S